MDYDEVISSVYDWISLEKVIWFLIFFWLSFPVVVWTPIAIEKQLFSQDFLWAVYALYYVMYVTAILGVIVLMQSCLAYKKFNSQKVTLLRLVDTVLLVFVEAWYVLVWNINKKMRVPQLLLLIAIPLLYLYWQFDMSVLPSLVLAVFVWAYLTVIVYNAVRVSMSMMAFHNEDIHLIESVKESWSLTHGRFVETISAIILALGSAFVLFALTVIILGALANLVLLFFFTQPIAYELAVQGATLFAFAPAIMGYHYSFASVFSQLVEHKHSSRRIRHILAKKVLSKTSQGHAHITPKRSFAKKNKKKK